LAIHETAIVAAGARIDESAEIGPFCIVASDVEIGARTVIESHARIGSRYGRVQIGADNLVQCGAVLGGPPQDHSYKDAAATRLEIGDGNRIGDYVSVSLGTVKGGGLTQIGNRCFIMAYAHLGHDCRLEDHVVITNGTQLAGHVTVEHHALLSGLAAVTQFVRLGAFSFLVAGSFANKDIPPYTIAEGHWATPRAVNNVGLKRAGFDAAARKEIAAALRILLDRSLTIEKVLARIEADCAPIPAIAHFIAFLKASERGVARA
jgi:UDP-N-acetylglucosamine acyltransferase